MSIEKFNIPVPSAESEGDKLEGFHRVLWERAKNLIKDLGAKLSTEESEMIKQIQERENGEEGEDEMFLDMEVDRNGENLNLRMIGQVDEAYDPNRKINYEKWDLSPQEEAERWLNREIIIGEKLNKFLGSSEVSADELIESSRQRDEEMFLLKKVKEEGKSYEEFGRDEGKALAQTLLNLQNELRTTDMVREIMSEEGIENKLELEQKIFEDYFDNFDGYMDNCVDILGDLDDEARATAISEKMEGYRETIEQNQLGVDEYSLAHGACHFDNMVWTEGKILLRDWRRPGTTQNKSLSLVYDLSDAFISAVENLEVEAAWEFIGGVKEELKTTYDQENVAAIINLAKLRSFTMIVNDLDGDKREFVEGELERI